MLDLGPDYVRMDDELYEWGVLDGGLSCKFRPDDDDPLLEDMRELHNCFELVAESALANPREDFYQGFAAMRVIRRKSDGQLFGHEYWETASKYEEPIDDLDDGIVEFLPVEPFTITGYKWEGSE